MFAVWESLRSTLRLLGKSPLLTLTALLTLAAGIGATTSIFSIVEGVLLRPLPFAEPNRLVTLADVIEGAGDDPIGTTAVGVHLYAQDARGFSALSAYEQTSFAFTRGDEPAEINASRLTASTFSVLGVAPALGRVFTQKEDDRGQLVAVLSYQMWHSRFNGDPHILGRDITLDGKPYEIIGVMPRQFEFPLVPGHLSQSELWVPMSFTQSELVKELGNWNFHMVGRLEPGVTIAEAQQNSERVSDEIMRSFPAAIASLRIRPVVRLLSEATVAQARPLVQTLFFAVTVVLLIACANLAGLLLVRVVSRNRELAVRLALGASGRTIFWRIMSEALVISIAGGALGLLLAWLALRIGLRLLPETLPRISSINLDWRVEIFAFGLALATGLLCGAAPALAARRTRISDVLKEAGRTGTVGANSIRLRSALVIAETAVALVLLIASGLLLRSFENLRNVDLGFSPDHKLTAAYDLPQKLYPTQASVDGFNEAVLQKLQHSPGIDFSGITSTLPAAGQNNTSSFTAEGYVPAKGGGLNMSWPAQVIGSYFSAMGIPLLRGRDFTNADRAGSPLVVIVNHALANRYWPGQDPVGKRLRWGLPESPTPWMTVVGEIGDVRQSTADAPIQDQIYQPAGQQALSFGSFAPPDLLNGNNGVIVLRGSLAPEQMTDVLRSVVRSIDPQLALTQVESMDRIVEEGQAPRRFNALLISGFAASAVLLAVLGIYSVIAYSAAMRTQEMAIRLALGSRRSRVLSLIVTSGAKLGLVGCGVGALLAVLFTRLLSSFLFEVEPLDPLVIVTGSLIMLLLTVAASAGPGLRAASIEPARALRTE